MSRSAMLVAACRMLAAELPPGERLIDDPLARLFVDEQAIAEARAAPGLQRVIRLRTRYIDDAVRQFTATYADSQVVLLGAGLDSRAFRLGATTARFFELDLAPTLAHKAAVLVAAGVQQPASRTTIGFDMTTGPVRAPLVAAGFDAVRSAIVVWEGVSFYLTDPDAVAAIEGVADLLAPGGVLVADYGERSWSRDSEAMAGKLRSGGEPLLNGLVDAVGTLRRCGFDVVDDAAIEELAPRYGLDPTERLFPARILTAVRA